MDQKNEDIRIKRQLELEDRGNLQNGISEGTSNIVEKMLVDNPHSNLEEMKHNT